jgi:hypothetical protein
MEVVLTVRKNLLNYTSHDKIIYNQDSDALTFFNDRS